MSLCLFSSNNLNSILEYIELQDIENFSLTSKYFYTFLNSKNNSYINARYRDITFKKYFNINNKKNYKLLNEYFLDDYYKTKNDWKNIFKQLYMNSGIYLKKKISEEIYNSFNIHCYMPYQRIENKILEKKNSTLHQIICYDMNKNILIKNYYYDKYFDKKKEKFSENKIEPLKKGLYFQEELINFKLEAKNYENKKIIKMIGKYWFKKLEKVYYSIIKKRKNNKKNKGKIEINSVHSVIYFLIWLNHTFTLFINLLYKYMYQFKNVQDSKIILNEYSKIHSNLINFGLMINEKFNNINIIFNFIQKGIIPTNLEFSIYNLFLNIMEKNFYQKLKPILNSNIQKVISLFYKEINDKSEICCNDYENNNIETNYTEKINEENEVDDYIIESISEKIDFEDDEDLNRGENLTYQEVLEEISNLILDFSINKDNANYINHSKINLNGAYNEYENLIIEKFNEKIKNSFENNEFDEKVGSLNVFFSTIKKLVSEKEGEGFKLIKRTKSNILKYSKGYFAGYLNKILNKKIIYDLNYYNININNNINKDKVFKEFSFYEKYNNMVDKFYNNKLHDIKNKFISENKDMIKKRIENRIDNELNSNEENTKLIMLIEEIILFFFRQTNLYNYEDEKIIEEIKNKKYENYFQSP